MFIANKQEDINFTWHNERRVENPEETFNLKPMTSEFLEKMQSLWLKRRSRVLEAKHGSERGDEKSHQHSSCVVGAAEKGKAMEMNTFAPDLNVDHIVPRIQFRKSRLWFSISPFVLLLVFSHVEFFLRLKSFKLKLRARNGKRVELKLLSPVPSTQQVPSFCHENSNFEQCFRYTFTWKFDFV